MNLYKINVKYKTMNLHSKFYILFVHNRKNNKKSDIRINIRIHTYNAAAARQLQRLEHALRNPISAPRCMCAARQL